MCDRIKAAVDARTDPSFVIMARTDARGVTGFDEAVRRARLYVAAGADAVFPEALEGAEEFAAFLKNCSQGDSNPFAPLRRLVRPYILRRLKTDKRIIADLPEKTELTAFCPLTRRQAALYQQAVAELAERIEAPEVEGIQRRGVILAFLTRLFAVLMADFHCLET